MPNGRPQTSQTPLTVLSELASMKDSNPRARGDPTSLGAHPLKHGMLSGRASQTPHTALSELVPTKDSNPRASKSLRSSKVGTGSRIGDTFPSWDRDSTETQEAKA